MGSYDLLVVTTDYLDLHRYFESSSLNSEQSVVETTGEQGPGQVGHVAIAILGRGKLKLVSMIHRSCKNPLFQHLPPLVPVDGSRRSEKILSSHLQEHQQNMQGILLMK